MTPCSTAASILTAVSGTHSAASSARLPAGAGKGNAFSFRGCARHWDPWSPGQPREGLLEFTDRGMLESQLDSVKGLFDMPLVPGTNSHLEMLQEELAAYFSGTLRQFTVPLVVAGTDFQERVWGQLRRIPYGQTRSYEEIASAVGATKAVRAVGRANGLNRIAIVIPCHRVVSKNGELCGYGGGLWRKKFMLDLERQFL